MAPLSPGSATIDIKFFVNNQQHKNHISDIWCIRFGSARCILHIERSYSRLLHTFGECHYVFKFVTSPSRCAEKNGTNNFLYDKSQHLF